MKFVLFRFANNLWKANKRAYPENVRKHWIEIKEDKSLELFAVSTKVRRRFTDVWKYCNPRYKSTSSFVIQKGNNSSVC